jgi:hypothetical protein
MIRLPLNLRSLGELPASDQPCTIEFQNLESAEHSPLRKTTNVLRV